MPKKLVEPEGKIRTSSSLLSSRLAIIAVGVLIIVLLLVLKNPKLFLAAIVNNQPITTWEFNQSLQKRFGARLLDQMIDERLIHSEALKQGVTVSSAEVDQKIQAIETQVGGKDGLNQLITSQGLNLEDLRTQIRLKLLVDKMLSKSVIVTEQEVKDFISKESQSLPATDSASQKKFVEETIKQQKLSEAFQSWYKNLRDKAKVYKFY
ncbi:SurA N-terminal domain-containing protein [Candidatus Gottesmanbacteria bacterium]|nr:SurA N-terminal domain-containing protein [Candidatus Gottesmanbacteria bacterium]